MKNKTKIELHLITKEDFEAYEAVRESGVTNMWAMGLVCELSGLEREVVLAIMVNYDKLCEKYPGVRKS